MTPHERFIDLIGTLIGLIGATQNAGAMLSIRKVGGRTHFMMLGLVWGFCNMLFSPLMMFMKPINSKQDSESQLTTVYGWTEVFYLIVICSGIVSF